MARPHTSLMNYTEATTSSSIGTNLRNAMATGPLGTWSVGPMHTFGSGTTERNYWVVSCGSDFEILFSLCNGSSVRKDQTFNANFKFDSNYDWTQQMLFFATSIDGGFEDAFTAGKDPIDSDYYTYITTTLGYRSPSRAQGTVHSRSGMNNPNFYFITDQTTNMMAVYINADIYPEYDIFLIADDLISAVNSESVSSERVKTSGSFLFRPLTGTLPAAYQYIKFWDKDGRLQEWDSSDFSTSSMLKNIPASSFSSMPTFPVTDVLIKNNDNIHAIVNKYYLRTTSQYMPKAYKSVFGIDVNYGWTSVIKYFITPWDAGAAGPT